MLMKPAAYSINYSALLDKAIIMETHCFYDSPKAYIVLNKRRRICNQSMTHCIHTLYLITLVFISLFCILFPTAHQCWFLIQTH